MSGPAIQRIVKQVLSGDSIILRDVPKGCKPEEKQVGLAWVSAPKMGRKSNLREETPEENFAFEAREFLRRKLIGRKVVFRPMYTFSYPSGASKECGLLFLETEKDGISIGEQIIQEGFAEVVRKKVEDPVYKRMLELEEKAKDSRKGKWISLDSNTYKKRTVKQELSQDTAEFLKGKTFEEGAIVEYVQNVDQLRIALLLDKQANEWQMITLRLSGIKCKSSNDPGVDNSKFFVESRILQKEVTIIIEDSQRAGDNPILLGSVLGGKDRTLNLAIELLRYGHAKILDNSLRKVPSPEAYRQAYNEGETKRAMIWNTSPSEQTNTKKETFLAKVIEIISGDALNVLSLTNNQVRKIFLASIRPPKRLDITTEQKVRALYDIPYMFEAREFLRKRLIGKTVQVIVDYIQQKTESYQEKVCATVLLNNVNIAEGLVSKGFATVVKHRADDEKKASQYDVLMDAEIKAEKSKKGLHGKPGNVKRIVELSNDLKQAKSFLPFLTKGGPDSRKEGIVEYVFSSSRLKVFIPKENCLINLILQGVDAPKANDLPYGKEGLELVRSLVHQRDIQVTVSSMDKVGNFIGCCYYEIENGASKNLSLTLIEKGLARNRDYKDNVLVAAEEEAKKAKKNIWQFYSEVETEELDEEDVEEEVEEEEGADKPNGKVVNGEKGRKKPVVVVVTESASDLGSFFVQFVESGEALERMLEELREELENNPPLIGAYTPKKGDIVAAKFSLDSLWYRAKIEKINVTTKEADIVYIDYGNREIAEYKNIAPLPSSKFSTSEFKPAAILCKPAYVSLPGNDLEAIQEAKAAFDEAVRDKQLYMKKEYGETLNSIQVDYVTLTDTENNEDIFLNLVEKGYFLVKDVRDRKVKKSKTLAEFKNAQEKAKKRRYGLWIYGDNTEDDAKEFGYNRD